MLSSQTLMLPVPHRLRHYLHAFFLMCCKAPRFEELAAMPAQPHIQIADRSIWAWVEGGRHLALASRLRLLLGALGRHNTRRHEINLSTRCTKGSDAPYRTVTQLPVRLLQTITMYSLSERQ